MVLIIFIIETLHRNFKILIDGLVNSTTLYQSNDYIYNEKSLWHYDVHNNNIYTYDISGVETASHTGHCQINLVNVW